MSKNSNTDILRRWKAMDAALAAGSLSVADFAKAWSKSEKQITCDLEAFRELGQRIEKPPRLSKAQVQVLRWLSQLKGPMKRTHINDRLVGHGIRRNREPKDVGEAVGYSDPEKRAAFERSKAGGGQPSLLTLGYVREVPVEFDSFRELGLLITPAGIEALARVDLWAYTAGHQPLFPASLPPE
jgi:hypothetical protein